MTTNDKAAAASATTALPPAGGTHGGLDPVALTIPSLSTLIGAFRTDDHRYYFNGLGPYPSVTTLLRIMDKPAVSTWKVKQAIAATHQAQWEGLEGEELCSYVFQHLRAAVDRAADVGTSVHVLADALGASESLSAAFEVPDGTQPYLDAYRGFLARYSASEIVSSEKMVWSLNGYAGTYDMVMRGPLECQHTSCLWLLDIKTASAGPYEDWALQLAGYRWADGVILPGNPQMYPMPEFDHTAVLHLRPDKYPDTGYRLVEYPTTYTEDYMAFLAALELYRWKSTHGRRK